MSPAVAVSELVKDYGALRAVDGVSFEVEQGEVFALLGPNGAGKSTIVEILEGHRTRTSGTVQVLDTDPASAGASFRDRIGIVLQSSGIDPELTAREAIDFYGAAYSRQVPTDELIELVELGEKADARVSTLSGGQQRRIDVARGLAGDPDVVFLDEPTTGFAPAARRRGWELVERLASQQRAVLLTTHYLDEAEQLADRVAVLSKGRIVAEGTPAELRARAGSSLIRFMVPARADPVSELLEPVSGDIVGRDRHVEITTATPTADLAHLTGWAAERGVELENLTVSTPSLEDVYLTLVGDDGAGEDDTPGDGGREP
ncbi:MAG: ABC transporter ATP-binding protein [Acidimicrobiaceae bacterium]|nr:ABC transporter ATP-binding protein [Acidimicrobiaceae bacterium]